MFAACVTASQQNLTGFAFCVFVLHRVDLVLDCLIDRRPKQGLGCSQLPVCGGPLTPP